MQQSQKLTLGEMRSDNGPHRLIIYCADFKCSHSLVVDAAPWGDDVRPLFEKAAMGPSNFSLRGRENSIYPVFQTKVERH